jgi:hydrogenase maturation protease
VEVATHVIAVGSPVMGDDGLGLHVLQRLQEDWVLEGVTLIDGGTWGMKLLPEIEDATRLMFLDAINTQKHPPGTVLLLERDEIPLVVDHNKLSPHDVGLQEVLAVAEFRGTQPALTCAVGVVPETVDISTELTPVVEASVGSCVDKVIERLRLWGHTCTLREAPVGA